MSAALAPQLSAALRGDFWMQQSNVVRQVTWARRGGLLAVLGLLASTTHIQKPRTLFESRMSSRLGEAAGGRNPALDGWDSGRWSTNTALLDNSGLA
jgi:hypothetical protein